MDPVKSILFTMDMEGTNSTGINYLTGENLSLEFCDNFFVDVAFNFKEGTITHLGSLNGFTTYLVELL